MVYNVNLLLLLTTLGYLEYLCFSLRPIFFNPCCALESSLVEASGSAGKESACHAGDTGDVVSTPGSERSPEGGHGDPLQCSCLENPMDIVAWRATVHEVTTSLTWLGDWTHSGVLEKKKKKGPCFLQNTPPPGGADWLGLGWGRGIRVHISDETGSRTSLVPCRVLNFSPLSEAALC